MAITTYAELTTAITTFLDINTADLSSVVADIITLGEKRVGREVRSREMETALTGTITAGVVALPSDYVALKYAYLNTTPVTKLQRVSVDYLINKYPLRSSQGVPLYIARDVGNFIFGPYADSAYTLGGTYYKRFAVLSSAVNTLFTNNPDLYLFACLAESEVVIGRDKRVPLWEAKYRTIKDMVNAEDKREMTAGSIPQVMPG